MAVTRNPEAGLRRHRIDFAREETYGNVGADPSWLKYSSAINGFTWGSGAEVTRVDNIGSADPTDQEKGPEDHDITVTYPMVKWFDDGSGNPLDASYDGMFRDADNLLPNSHTVVERDERELIDASNTLNGSTARPTRMFRVGEGGLVDTVNVNGDPSDNPFIQIELAYKFQFVRPYQVDQPTDSEGATTLDVVSSDASDTTQTLTIEDEGAANTEDVALNGTTTVTTTATFSDIDALDLDAETQGDVTVSINAGDDLAVIRGRQSYDDVEGDTGIPALGSGSREALPGTDYEKFLGDTITRGGADYPHEIPSVALTVENNVETSPRNTGWGQAYHPAQREVTFEADMYGEQMTYDLLDYHLRNESQDHDWDMTGGTVRLQGAHLIEPGEVAFETQQAVLTTSNTFRANDLTLV